MKDNSNEALYRQQAQSEEEVEEHEDNDLIHDQSYFEIQEGEETKSEKYDRQTYEQKEKKKKLTVKILIHVLALAALGGAYYMFVHFMVARCDNIEFAKDEDCIEGVLVPQISQWMKVIILCAILIMGVFFLSILRVLHRVFVYISLGLMLYLTAFHYDVDPNKITLRNYEGAHSLFLGACFLIIGFSVLGGYICYKVYQKKKKCFYFGVLLTVIFLFKINHKIYYSCENWEKGLIDDEIDFGQPYCKIDIPGVCWPTVIDGLLNFGPKTCEISEKKAYILNMLKEYNILRQGRYTEKEANDMVNNVKYLGWPLTKDFKQYEREFDNLQNTIIEKTEILESEDQGYRKGMEAIVDVQNTDLKLKVKRDEELIQKRKQETVTGVDSMSKNIIVVYVDTVSRVQSFRKLKKTMEYFRRYSGTKYEEMEDEVVEDKEKKIKYKKNKTSFEFFRYHSIDNKTFSNLFQLHYGFQKIRTIQALNRAVHQFSFEKKKKQLFNDFKDAGYIVGHGMNTCSMKCIFRSFIAKGVPVQQYFLDEPADHELMLMDPLYINKNNYFDAQRGVNSVYRRCLYGKDTNEHVFEYGLQFLREYNDQKKALYLEYTDGHEITSEVVQYIDEPLYNFLTAIENEGFLEKDTTLYLLSDHGQHLVSAFYLFGQVQGKKSENIRDVFQTERMLPMFYMMVTNDILRKYDNLGYNLQKNSQAIFGMGEIRLTLLQNAYGREKYDQIRWDEENEKEKIRQENPDEEVEFCDIEYKENLFDQLVDSRSCYDIGMVVFQDQAKFCSCRPWENNNDDDKNDNQNGDQGNNKDKN